MLALLVINGNVARMTSLGNEKPPPLLTVSKVPRLYRKKGRSNGSVCETVSQSPPEIVGQLLEPVSFII